MDWILENPIQIQIFGMSFKSKSIFFYKTVPYGPRALTKVNMMEPRARNPLEVLQSKRGSFFKVHDLRRWPASSASRINMIKAFEAVL